MYGSYYDKEFILVDRFSTLEIWDFKSQKVIRGDVVVFKPEVDEVKEFFIKRVVWMPGDTIKIEGWEVYLKKEDETEFTMLVETYLNEKNAWNTRSQNKSNIYVVPENSYFVMWDNRNESSDSRSCFSHTCLSNWRNNYISKEFVVWKVLLDFGYFNFKNLSFTHPDKKVDIIEDGKIIWKEPLCTKPKWTHSVDSYTY